MKILESGDEVPVNFTYDDSGNTPTLLMVHGEFTFCPYGEKNPKRLIERWASNLKLVPESLYSLSGMGDGSHARYLLENSGTGINLMVVEKDPALLRETLTRFDLSDLLANDRFLIGTGEPNDQFFTPIQGAALTGVAEVNSLTFAPLQMCDEAYYDRVRNELARQYLVIRPLMEVNVRTATNLQENTLRNLPHMFGAPDISELAGKFEDIPFILIGAGPSLDESIDFLKDMQDKAIIVASNSPYRKLINNGIRPHLVVTADPMEPTLAGFQNVKLDHVPLACPFSAYPEIVERFSGRIVSWCTFNPIVKALREQRNQPEGTPIMEQGTVSGCVLDISRVLGCKKVMFIGQDMCVRDDGRYYTDDSFYADAGNHYASTDKGQRLPGNTQEKVLVEPRLFVYLKTFEQFISKKHESVEYRNLARTGARIEGAPYITYEEATEWVGEGASSKEFDTLLGKLLENQEKNTDLKSLFDPIKKYANDILETSLQGAVEVEMLPEKFKDVNYSDNKKLKNQLLRGADVNKLVDSNQTLWHVLLEGRTKRELVIYQRLLREIVFKNKTWESVQKNKEYFWALSEGCYWLLNTLDDLIYNSTE
ncbi:MAG: motility associated factor glycosyltransferase family protein [Opitutales bacterium]|nr:motility associated factor glycosyltransferase family protein [Opitutales bacterium]